MGGVWGNKIKLSIFGESHGEGIGIVIDGIEPGIKINMDNIEKDMERRAPGRNSLSTQRKEGDKPEILSGIFNGITTGAPISMIIRNTDKRSRDYSKIKDVMRPGHADFPGYIRYNGFNDYRGGGHFSGRITAPLVFAGAVCKQILKEKGIIVAAHVKSIKNIKDKSFIDSTLDLNYLNSLKGFELPLIDKSIEENMRKEILEAKEDMDSVGGTVECGVFGISAGVGNPFFDSVESTLAHLLFSVPAVKGVEFGRGFELTSMRGSEANDEIYYEGGVVKTKTNNNGGILGGITNGMPIIFTTAIKPTSSIGKKQNTINIGSKENTILKVEGRHDPCIVQRAIPVIEAVTAIAICELLS